MTDTITEAIAARLRDFIQETQRKANTSEFPNRVNTQPSRGRPKEPLLKTCEECLSKLAPDELAQLDSAIQKMSGDFRSPPGAIIPP
jgi:hypothetical protein